MKTHAEPQPERGARSSSLPPHRSSPAGPVISRPGDADERMADQLADQVTRTGEVGAYPRGSLPPPRGGGGRPLEPATRAFMEPRFGVDFSNVRVHADARAAESARALGARAYAVGTQLVFGAGEYQPRSSEGRALLAHELAHVALAARSPSPGAKVFRQAAGPDATEAEERPVFVSASDQELLTRIRSIIASPWPLGSSSYYERQLEALWNSFGDRLPFVATEDRWKLLQESIDRGAEPDNISGIQALRRRFKADVKTLAKRRLAENRRRALAEMARLGFTEGSATDEASRRERINALWGIRLAASLAHRARLVQSALRSLQVGYEWEFVAVPGARVASRLAPAYFNPEARPLHGPEGTEHPPLPTWEDVNKQYQRVSDLISGLAPSSTALSVLIQGEGLEKVATGTSEEAAAALRADLESVLANIDAIAPKVDDDTLDYRELGVLHEQLFSGVIAAPSGVRWSDPLPHWVARESLSDYQTTGILKTLGLGALAAAAFIVARVAPVGSTLSLTAAGSGVVASGAQAVFSWQRYEDLSQAARSNVSEETALVSRGQASGALLNAVLDTAFAFIDLHGPVSRGVSAAQRAIARETLAAAERSVAERAAREGAEAGGRAAVRAGIVKTGRKRMALRRYILGPENAPTLADIQELRDRAWAALGGAPKSKPSITWAPKLHPEVLGAYYPLKNAIGINPAPAVPLTRGWLFNTVYHEAWHARFAAMFPSIATSPVQDVLTRFLDEWIAYAIGGGAHALHGATMADRLVGVARMLASPVLKYGSLQESRLLMVPAMVVDAAIIDALCYIAWLYLESDRVEQTAAPEGPAEGATSVEGD